MADCIHEMPAEWCEFCKPVAVAALPEKQLVRLASDRTAGAAPLVRRTAAAGVLGVDQQIAAQFSDWNRAIAAAVFGPDKAQAPVYLDVEDEVLGVVASTLVLDLEASQVEAQLCQLVGSTLLLDASSMRKRAFAWHLQNLARWKRGDGRVARIESPPPVIALLAVFARAAEIMGHDEVYQPNAYYPRLAALLDCDEDGEERLRASYQSDAEELWGALDEWLRGLEGRAGRSTIEALGHRYVGLAVSQALIREADRQQLRAFFTGARLEPGLELAMKDMDRLLGPWIIAGHSTAALSRLWSTPKGRSVLCETAVQALSQWDGAVPDSEVGDRSGPPPRLTAKLHKRLRRSVLHLGFALQGNLSGRDALPVEWQIDSSAGTPTVEMGPAGDLLLAPTQIPPIDSASLLNGELSIKPGVGSSGSARSRRPTPLVILRHVPDAGMYVEVDRPRLGERHLVIYNSNAPKFNGESGPGLHGILERIAEPGIKLCDDVEGLPDGWSAYRNVVVVRSHDLDDMEFDPLRLLQSVSIVVDGGLRLRGQARRWHVDVAVTVRATSPGASALTLALYRTDIEVPIQEWTGDVEEIVAPLTGLGLGTGSYRLQLRARSGSSEQHATSTFSLHDSDSRPPRDNLEDVNYSVECASGCLSARSGARSLDNQEAVNDSATDLSPVPGPVWWETRRHVLPGAKLTKPAPPDSCTFTGAHRSDLTLARPGVKARGECRDCGRVKWYSAKGKLRQDVSEPEVTVPALRALRLPNPSTDVLGDALLDAIRWMGQGTVDELSRLVRQIDDSPVAVDEVVRALEVTAHINVRRDVSTWKAIDWNVASPALYELATGEWLIAGAVTRTMGAGLGAAIAERGGLLVVDDTDWLPRRTIANLTFDEVLDVAETLKLHTFPQAGINLLKRLPKLSGIVDELSVESSDGVFKAEWFHAGIAHWVEVQSINGQGAFRLSNGYLARYYVRVESDLEQRKLHRADARIVKHVAAREKPMVGYEEPERRLVVPLGAELPGLYGRAAALLAGRPPRQVEGKPLLAYTDVGPKEASMIAKLLGE